MGVTLKVSKIDILKPQNFGGLSMVDIFSFWQSLKCTWFRRLMTSDSFWPEILQLELTNCNSSLLKILLSGPSHLQNVAKQTKNRFWQFHTIVAVITIARHHRRHHRRHRRHHDFIPTL